MSSICSSRNARARGDRVRRCLGAASHGTRTGERPLGVGFDPARRRQRAGQNGESQDAGPTSRAREPSRCRGRAAPGNGPRGDRRARGGRRRLRRPRSGGSAYADGARHTRRHSPRDGASLAGSGRNGARHGHPRPRARAWCPRARPHGRRGHEPSAIASRRRTTMLIVDAQIHLWNAGNPTSPWHRQIPAYLKDDALKEMDAGGVDAAILTPHTPWDPNANELCIEAVRAHPDRFAILGNFPLDRPESRALVDTWKQRPGMLGCRFTFIGPTQEKWPTDGTVDWLWPAAERAGLPIAMMAANFLPKVAEVARRHPNLKLILDHLGRPRGAASPSERWANLAEGLALAKHPNVAMKATGAPSYSDQPYPFRDIHDNLHRLYDAFGPTRWFWGTDITRMPCSWRQCVTLFTEELPWLKGRDLELVMGRAVCDWLGWKR